MVCKAALGKKGAHRLSAGHMAENIYYPSASPGNTERDGRVTITHALTIPEPPWYYRP